MEQTLTFGDVTINKESFQKNKIPKQTRDYV